MGPGSMTWDRWPPVRTPQRRRRRRPSRLTGEKCRPPKTAKKSEHGCPSCIGAPKLREIPGSAPWIGCCSCGQVFLPPVVEKAG